MAMVVSACNTRSVQAGTTTYRDVLIKDLVTWLNRGSPDEYLELFKIEEIVPYFMTDYRTIIFNAKPEYRAILYGGDGLFCCKYDEELYLSFDFQQDIPMLWNNHSIFDLQLGIPNNLLTREGATRIQKVYDTKAFDYSILYLTYSEEQ